MHKLLIISIAVLGITISFDSRKVCNILPDGLNKLEYTRNSFENASMIKIENEQFYQFKQNGDTLKGKIDWIYDCSFIFNFAIRKIDTSSLEAVLSKSFGRSFVELNRKNGDTVIFRTSYTGNLEITLNEGRFISASQIFSSTATSHIISFVPLIFVYSSRTKPYFSLK